MALKSTTLEKLKSTLKHFDIDKLIAAIKAEDEQDVDVPEVIVLTTAEQASREDVLKNNNIKAGKEIAIKELKEATGLDYEGEGSKDGKKFITEYQKKILKDANIQESEKIKERDTVIEGLRNNLTQIQAEKETFVRQTKEAQLDSDLLSWTIDKKPDNLTNKEWLAIIKMNNEVIEHEGALVVKREGQIVANKTDLKPIPAKDALISFIDERKIGKVQQQQQQAQGRGEGDSKAALLGIANMKQFKEYLKANNISENGDAAKAELKIITDANPNFDFKE